MHCSKLYSQTINRDITRDSKVCSSVQNFQKKNKNPIK